MRNKLIAATILALCVAGGLYANGQWQPKKLDGTTLGIYSAPGDTSIMARVRIDTAYGAMVGLRDSCIADVRDTVEGGDFVTTGEWDFTGTLKKDGTEITSSAAELNKLDGASANVTAANLNTLTGAGDADALHSHGADNITDLGDSIRTALNDSLAVMREALSDSIRVEAIPDSLSNYGGPARFANVQRAELASDSTRIVLLDTTITSTSVKKLVYFNLRDPNQLGKYVGTGDNKRLVSAYDDYRTVETGNSTWQDEGIRHPERGLGVIPDGADDVILMDDKLNQVLVFTGATNNIISAAAPVLTDLKFKDMKWFTGGTTGLPLRWIDFWADGAIGHSIAGQIVYNGLLTDRNSAKAYTIVASTPATVNNTVYAVAVTRSPFPGLAGQDEFGRQRALWGVSTAADGGSWAVYNSAGVLSIYDFGATNSGVVGAATMLPNGSYFLNQSQAARDVLRWNNRSVFAVTGDARVADDTWRNTGSGSEDLLFTDAAVFSGVAALPGISSAGRNSPRVFLATDEGLAILDAKASDNTNGAKQIITNEYVSPVMWGDVVAAWSPASTASVGLAWSTAGTACSFVVTTDGPLSHAWRFDGVDDAVNISTVLDSLGDDTVGSWHIQIKPDDGQVAESLRLVGFGDANADEGLRLYVHPSGTINAACTIAGTNQWVFDSDAALIADGAATAWSDIWLVHDGVAPVLYFNGRLVDITFTTSTDKTSWFAACSGLDVGHVGSFMRNSGSLGGYYDGDLTPPVLSKHVPTAAEVLKSYTRGLDYIESPTPDTLYAADVDGIHADPISGVITGYNQTHASRRLPSGALMDSINCSQCGTIQAAVSWTVPGADSTGFAMGGTTGLKKYEPDPTVVAAAAYQWPLHSQYWIGEGPVVADSTGHGDTWTVQDALATANNVGIRQVEVQAPGSYHDPVTSMLSHGMQLRGVGGRPLITNQNTTGSPAFTTGAFDTLVVEDVDVWTATGGAGGNENALTVTSGADYGILERVRVRDSDATGLDVSAGIAWTLRDCEVLDSDGNSAKPGKYGRVIGGRFTGLLNLSAEQVSTTIVDAYATGVTLAAGGDSTVVMGSRAQSMTVAATNVNSVLIGNICPAFTDAGSGTIIEHNSTR